MEQKTRAFLTSAAIFPIGLLLVGIGVSVWVDGNTTFGGALGFLGIFCTILRLGYTKEQRKKKAAREAHPEAQEEVEKKRGRKVEALAHALASARGPVNGRASGAHHQPSRCPPWAGSRW
jgi:hypothetical protein